MLWLQLPWERERALRLLNLQTALELALARRPRQAADVPDPELKRLWLQMLSVVNRPAVTELLGRSCESKWSHRSLSTVGRDQVPCAVLLSYVA